MAINNDFGPLNLRGIQSLIPVITGTLPVGNSPVGSWVAMVGVSINVAANTDKTITHNLGRVPNGYIVFRTAKGGVVYDGSAGVSAWTKTTMVLRDTVANDTVSLLVL